MLTFVLHCQCRVVTLALSRLVLSHLNSFLVESWRVLLMETTHFNTGEATEPVRFQGVYPVSRLGNADSTYSELPDPQGTVPTLRSRSGSALLENSNLQCPPVFPPDPLHEQGFTNADLQSKRNFLAGVSSAPSFSSFTRTEVQSIRGLPPTKSCGQSSQCSSMSHQQRKRLDSFAANLEQQSTHFKVEQQWPHVSSVNGEHRDHKDSCSASFERMTHLNEFPTGLEQKNHVDSFCTNPEQSIHVNSSASSCCQPQRYHGRQGEPLYKSLLRPHHYSQSPLLDYDDGPHHLLHHECTFEAENSLVSNRHPRQCADCISCTYGFCNLDENIIRRGSVSKGQSFHSSRALLNEITLYNWYLIRSSGSHSSEIAVGGFLSNRGTENERIETSTIVKRLEDCKVLTKDGNVVNLMGPIDDYRTVSNGFSLQTVHLFISGFPHIWNLVVGMGLPSKGVAGTNTSSRSCDFYGGEVTSQISLQKDIQSQGKCLHQPTAPEGNMAEMTPFLDVERPHGFKLVTEKGSQDVEAVAKIPESAVMQEVQEQGNTLLNVKPQVSEDQLPSIIQSHEEELQCLNLVGTESDKETGSLRNCKSDKETGLPRDCKTEREASHGQMKCTAKQKLMDSMNPTSEVENMPIESVEIAMTESRSEVKDGDLVTKALAVQETTSEENQGKKAFVEIKADVNKPLDIHDNAETVALSDELDLSSAQSPEKTEHCRESRMAKKESHRSSSRKRKVNFNIQDDVKNKAQSCTSVNPEASTKNLGKSCSLNSSGAEYVPSTKSMDAEKSTVTRALTDKQKGKRKKKARFLLPKYKRSNKPMVKVDTDKDRKDDKGANGVCDDKVLEIGCKRQKRMARNRKQGDGQNGAILSQPSSPDQTAEGKAGIIAPVLEPILNRRVKTRQGDKEKLNTKKAAPKKIIAKRRGCFANLQHTLNKAKEYNAHSRMKKNDLVSSIIDKQKGELKINDNTKVGSKRRKSGEGDSDSRSSTSKPRREKSFKKIERGDLEDFTREKKFPEGYCNKEAHAECDIGLSTMASPRKRLKQILPPPLPLPLVSVSKQLVSKAFGLKTSRSGRLLVPALAHWRGQSLVRDMDGGIIAIEDGCEDAPREDTGCFTFKPPMEARAKKLQKWLCDTATECLTKKLKARKSAGSHKQKSLSA